MHLILVLRSLGQPVPELEANAIIETYLEVLKAGGDDGLVAMYAACLREGSGEVSYANFLRSESFPYQTSQSQPAKPTSHPRQGRGTRGDERAGGGQGLTGQEDMDAGARDAG